MTNRTKIATALAFAVGLAATPGLAQSLPSDSASYNRDGTLNVWGAHIDPAGVRGGLIGGVGNVVGGVTLVSVLNFGQVAPDINDQPRVET